VHTCRHRGDGDGNAGAAYHYTTEKRPDRSGRRRLGGRSSSAHFTLKVKGKTDCDASVVSSAAYSVTGT
jgi:hypothetical protein